MIYWSKGHHEIFYLTTGDRINLMHSSANPLEELPFSKTRNERRYWQSDSHKLKRLLNLEIKQESPPAWTQEAYHPPCSKYSLCCPNWVPPTPILTWPRGYPAGGGTWPGYPPRVPLPSWPGGVPDLGTPPAGYPPSRVPPGRVPPSRVPPQTGPSRIPPSPQWLPHGILGNVAKHYGIWVPPPPGVDWQTKWNYYLLVVLRTRAVIINDTKQPELSRGRLYNIVVPLDLPGLVGTIVAPQLWKWFCPTNFTSIILIFIIWFTGRIYRRSTNL